MIQSSVSSAIMMSSKIKIVSIESKGKGVIAIEDIDAGELLISEEPLLIFITGPQINC